MKAIRVQQYGGPEQLRYEDAPKPQPGPGQVLIRVRATSVNPWDYKLASGIFQKMVPLELPYIPGGEFSGLIEAVGPAATDLKLGQEVYGNSPRGAYAEFVAVDAATVAPKPKKLTHLEAATVPVAAQTAWQGLFDHARLGKGQTVLIHAAAGGVGSFAVQLAHWKGARVLATGSAANADYLKSLGADVAIDYKTTPFETVAKDIDVVFDLVGGETQARSFNVLRKAGHLIATAQPPSQDLAKKAGVQAMMMQMTPTRQRLQKLAELFDAGTIRTVVTKIYPLSAAREAWEYGKSGHTRGKVAIEVA
jgi:NADPH:quinone reductase-like Zn-dependent oxidoreductase